MRDLLLICALIALFMTTGATLARKVALSVGQNFETVGAALQRAGR